MMSTENVVARHIVDRERHAIERDRPFGAMKRDSAFGARKHNRACRSCPRATDFRQSVDVAGDDMAAELVADLERALEIDLAPACATGPQS